LNGQAPEETAFGGSRCFPGFVPPILSRQQQFAPNRSCYVLRRTSLKPNKSGITEATIYIDEQTWFEVGTVLTGPGQRLIGECLFRDIHRNPKLKSDQFQPSALISE
jgi:hypothetical protein